MKRLLLLFTLLAFFGHSSMAQVATDSLSGHDIIVMRSGKMLRAKVLEIGIHLVKYKRAGYLNGPTYSLPRADVYAINYPDSRSDYLTIPDSTDLFGKPAPVIDLKKEKKASSFDPSKNGQASIGLGFFRSFSKGDGSLDGLSQKRFLPGFFLRYSFEQSPGLRLGIQLGTASYRFEGDGFDSYDDVLVSGKVDESVFSLSAYGKYELQGEKFRPYAIAGLGLRMSSVETQLAVTPLATEAGYLVNSGTRSSQLGVLMRIGASYDFSQSMNAYFDVGTGLSLVQAGIIFKLSTPKSVTE